MTIVLAAKGKGGIAFAYDTLSVSKLGENQVHKVSPLFDNTAIGLSYNAHIREEITGFIEKSYESCSQFGFDREHNLRYIVNELNQNGGKSIMFLLGFVCEGYRILYSPIYQDPQLDEGEFAGIGSGYNWTVEEFLQKNHNPESNLENQVKMLMKAIVLAKDNNPKLVGFGFSTLSESGYKVHCSSISED